MAAEIQLNDEDRALMEKHTAAMHEHLAQTVEIIRKTLGAEGPATKISVHVEMHGGAGGAHGAHPLTTKTCSHFGKTCGCYVSPPGICRVCGAGDGM